MEEPEEKIEVPEKSWGDNQAERMAKAQRLLNGPLRSAASFKRDEDRLDKAYHDTTSKGTYYDPDTRSMCVKGTQTGRDI